MRHLLFFAAAFIYAVTVQAAISEQNSDIDIGQVKEVLSGDDISAVDALIAQNIDLNMRDENGDTMLLYTLMHNDDLTMAKQLIIAGADINAPSSQTGITPLILATSTAEMLQNQLPTISKDNMAKLTDSELKKFMLDKMNRAYEMVKMLVELGADINQETPYGTPLMDAVKNEWNEPIIKFLIEQGAKVNLQDRLGRTALFYASAFDCNKNISLLLASGGDVSIRDIDGKSYMEAQPKEFSEQ